MKRLVWRSTASPVRFRTHFHNPPGAALLTVFQLIEDDQLPRLQHKDKSLIQLNPFDTGALAPVYSFFQQLYAALQVLHLYFIAYFEEFVLFWCRWRHRQCLRVKGAYKQLPPIFFEGKGDVSGFTRNSVFSFIDDINQPL